MFSIRHGFVSFFSNRPGSYVAMFGPDGKKLVFRKELSYLHDAEQIYIWVFEYTEKIKEKDTFLFANANYAVVGEMHGHVIDVVRRNTEVFCDQEGHPERVVIQPHESEIG